MGARPSGTSTGWSHTPAQTGSAANVTRTPGSQITSPCGGAKEFPATTSASPHRGAARPRERALSQSAAREAPADVGPAYACGGRSLSPSPGIFASVMLAVHTCSPPTARISVLVVIIVVVRILRMLVTTDSAWSTSPAWIGRV